MVNLKVRPLHFHTQWTDIGYTHKIRYLCSFTHSPIFSSFPYLPLYSIMPPFHREAYLCVYVINIILHKIAY